MNNPKSLNQTLQSKLRIFRSSKELDKERLERSGGPDLKGLLLPNVATFLVLDREEDRILEKLKVRRAKNRTFLSIRGENSGPNAYLKWTWRRLSKYAKQGDGSRFGNLIKLLLLRSTSMRVLMLHRTEKTWYKSKSLKTVVRGLKELDILIKKTRSNFNYKEVNIPKPDGTQRKLSVPKLAWRMLLNIKAKFLQIWLKERVSGFNTVQHGLIPGRGPGEAWKNLIEKLETAETVIEFDLSKFFDRTPWKVINAQLKYLKVPKYLIDWEMRTLLQGALKRPKERLEFLAQRYEDIEEPDLKYPEIGFSTVDMKHMGKLVRIVSNAILDTENPHRLEGKSLMGTLRAYHKGEKVMNLSQPVERIVNGEILYIERPWKHSGHGILEVGVPQGYGLSPLLACISLNPIYDKWKDNLLMYMDDGILFGKDIDLGEFCFDLQSLGSHIQPKKTQYLKRNGKWMVDSFKFLGIRYDTVSKSLKGDPRSGLGKESLNLDPLCGMTAEELNMDEMSAMEWRNSSNLEKIMKVGLWDYNMNRMLGNETDQEETRIHRSSLWTKMHLSGEDSRTLSSRLVKNLLKAVENPVESELIRELKPEPPEVKQTAQKVAWLYHKRLKDGPNRIEKTMRG